MPTPADLFPPRLRRRLRTTLWNLRFVLAAVCLGAAATLVLRELRPPPPRVVPIVIADRALTAGSTLGIDDLRVLDMPPELVPEDALTTVAQAEGRVLAIAVAPGTAVTGGLLADSTASAAPPGTVVAGVRLAEPALTRILGPGVHVDLLAPSASSESAPALTLARRALVLPSAGLDAETPSGGLLGGTTAETTDLILVAVTPDEAGALANVIGLSPISAVVVH